jgi:hypothetical protein
MPPSPEEVFQAALATYLLHLGLLTPDEFIGDHLTIVETSSPLRPNRTGYVLLFPSPAGLPPHRAYGLLDIASQKVDDDDLSEEDR